MFASNEDHFGSPKETWRRWPRRVWRAGRPVRLAGLAVAAAGLCALVPATASAAGATLVTQSAKSGELQGGRLTLRGVSGRVTYVLNTGRRGTLSVRRLHRRLFLPGLPATGTLHVAGYRGGDEPSFRLSKPRRNAARHTVSYRAKRLDHKPLPRRAVRAAGISRPPRRFGAASLSIVPHPRLTGGDNGGNDCSTTVTNNTPFLFQASAESKWDTDNWNPGIPFQHYLDGDGSVITWESDGGLWRGCSNSGSWTIVPDPYNQNPPSATVTASTTYPWTDPFSNTCTSTNPDFICQPVTNNAGNSSWSITWSQ
jgi:hypothetical protein